MGWNESIGAWGNIWTRKYAANTTYAPFNIPLSKDEVAICYSFNMTHLGSFSTLGIQKNGFSPLTMMYVHAHGQLFEPSRTNVRFPILDRVQKTYKLILGYNIQLWTEENACSTNSISFDECVTSFAHERMMKEANCSLLFMEEDETACRNFSISQKAMEAYWRSFWNVSMRSSICSLSCQFYNVEIEYQNNDILLELFTQDSHRYTSGDNHRILLNIPSIVGVTETRYSYSFVSFIAELGGWLGLFLGNNKFKLFTFIRSLKVLERQQI